MSKTYPILEEGEWFEPPRKDFRFQCCSCGLVHRMRFKMVPNANGGKSIRVQMFRDNRATGQVHRHMKTKAEK